MTNHELELFNKYQTVITRVVYKFRYLGGNKHIENCWRHYIGLELYGLDLHDVYQIANSILIENIRKLQYRTVDNPWAYLFKAVYRQLLYRINKQEQHINAGFLCDDYHGLYTLDSMLDDKELHDIVHDIIGAMDYKRRYVICHLHGIDNCDIQSMAEIGRELGVTYQRVQGIYKSIMRSIHKDRRVMDKLQSML